VDEDFYRTCYIAVIPSEEVLWEDVFRDTTTQLLLARLACVRVAGHLKSQAFVVTNGWMLARQGCVNGPIMHTSWNPEIDTGP